MSTNLSIQAALPSCFEDITGLLIVSFGLLNEACNLCRIFGIRFHASSLHAAGFLLLP